jgi:hypothetical protein
MAHHISQLESELQNIPEAAAKASLSFSVSEKLARYGSPALSGVEHLTLLVGKESIALALIRHFGSLRALARASFQELGQFLPQRKAEAVAAALSIFAIAETEHARSEQLDNPESIYRACIDMKLFNQLYSHFAAKSDSPPRDGMCNQQSNIIQVSIWATTPKYNKLYTPEDSSVND